MTFKPTRWDWRSNCFGYAVNTKKWLLPKAKRKWSFTPLELEEEYGLKPVSKSEMVLGKEYVAYRYCSGDFHFMKRDTKGHWRHKMGSLDPVAISQKEVFANAWDFRDLGGRKYNSKLYLFERSDAITSQ